MTDRYQLWDRVRVELTGKQGVDVRAHPLGPQCRMLDQFWLIADPEDLGFTPHAVRDGFWEAWITTWVMQQLTPDHVCVDVGANMGYYTLLAASLGCPTVAFEPQHDLADRLKESVRVNDYTALVTVVNAAVSHTPGTTLLTVPDQHGMNASMTHLSYSPKGTYRSYEVETVTLDYLTEWLPNRPMLVKIDAEGAEPLVWAGMQALLQRPCPLTVLMEFRWDRYEEPMAFADCLFQAAAVSYVGFTGAEVPLHHATQLATQQHEDWMLVLRPQSTPRL